MKFYIEKKIKCDNASLCSDEIKNKIEAGTGAKLSKENESDVVDGHLSILHVNGEHEIWLFLYEKNKVHESSIDGRVRLQKDESVRKYKGEMPSQKQIEKLF